MKRVWGASVVAVLLLSGCSGQVGEAEQPVQTGKSVQSEQPDQGAEPFPEEAVPAARPEGAKVLATETVSDDDDGRLRAAVQVIDVPRGDWGSVTKTYTAAYQSLDGWTVRRSSAQGLCIVKEVRQGVTALVEVWPYQGSRVPRAKGRYLTAASWMESQRADCGLVAGWVPSDLLPAEAGKSVSPSGGSATPR